MLSSVRLFRRREIGEADMEASALPEPVNLSLPIPACP